MDTQALGFPPEGLQGKVAIVTGVSRRMGIGAAVCRLFASCGVDLLFTHWLAYDLSEKYDADEEQLAALEAEFRGHGVRVVSFEADLGVPESPKRVMEHCISHLGVPSILVNNATHWSPGRCILLL